MVKSKTAVCTLWTNNVCMHKAAEVEHKRLSQMTGACSSGYVVLSLASVDSIAPSVNHVREEKGEALPCVHSRSSFEACTPLRHLPFDSFRARDDQGCYSSISSQEDRRSGVTACTPSDFEENAAKSHHVRFLMSGTKPQPPLWLP